MGRIAGDDPGYSYKLCRPKDIAAENLNDALKGKTTRVWDPTEYGLVFPSASTVIKEVLGKPASAMAWWGYRIGLTAIAEAMLEDPEVLQAVGDDAETLEAFLKERGVNPNMKTDEASDRGNNAHGILETLAAGELEYARKLAAAETDETGNEYGLGVIAFWEEAVLPFLESGAITQVRSEIPVVSLVDLYAGQFDLALLWSEKALELGIWGSGWEILDLKTHKPADGFTKPGKGPAYISDVAQNGAYAHAWEEMGQLVRSGVINHPSINDAGPVIAQRVIVARDREYRGKRWLEDTRTVDFEFFRLLRQAYDHRLRFEKGAA